MIEVWLDDPELAVEHDRLPITYVEYDQNDDGNYVMDLSYFAADPERPDGPFRWHIGVYFEVPPEARDDAYRVVNDIVSQTSGPPDR